MSQQDPADRLGAMERAIFELAAHLRRTDPTFVSAVSGRLDSAIARTHADTNMDQQGRDEQVARLEGAKRKLGLP